MQNKDKIYIDENILQNNRGFEKYLLNLVFYIYLVINLTKNSKAYSIF